jgi:hypothetical protein
MIYFSPIIIKEFYDEINSFFESLFLPAPLFRSKVPRQPRQSEEKRQEIKKVTHGRGFTILPEVSM